MQKRHSKRAAATAPTSSSPRKPVSPSGISLLPIEDEAQARQIFSACHDLIYFDTAKDPAACFDLMALVIAAKVLDERRNAPNYHFFRRPGESPADTVARFNLLLSEASDWLSSGRTHLENGHLHKLSELSLIEIIRLLQMYSLTETGSASNGTDLLGIVYERFVGATFRGELGSYFTPRNIADFMVRLANVVNGTVLDPSCGSGGLLLAARRYAAERSAVEGLHLFGNDLNPRMVEAAKVNFLMHGLPPASILAGDGADLERMARGMLDVPVSPSNAPFVDSPGFFDFVLANPPFAGHEKNQRILSRLSCARRLNGSGRSVNRILPFLELIIGALKPHGIAGVVLPTSVLNAEEQAFAAFRTAALDHVELVAIIGLPENAFVHTDCGVHGGLLFFKRCFKPRKRYNVFVGWAEHLGYDRLGKPTKVNDFPELLERFRARTWPAENTVSIVDLIEHGRWDPAWLRAARRFTPQRSENIRLTDICEIRDARWSRRQIRDDTMYRYFEVGDADIHTGEVLAVKQTSGFELAKKGRIRNIVRSGDILLPNHRDSLIASSAANGRSVVIVGKTLNNVLTTDRFLVLRPKIDPLVLAWILNSAPIRRQLVARCRGSASLDIRDHILQEVVVPQQLIKSEECEAIRKLAIDLSKTRVRESALYAKLMTRIEDCFSGIVGDSEA